MTTPLPPPPSFVDLEPPHPFERDNEFAAAFLAAAAKQPEEVEDIPIFLSNPRPEFLRAPELIGLLAVLANAASGSGA